MSVEHSNSFPKLHNAMWPGLVGKGSPGAEPCLDLDTMLDLTARAEVDGARFDGVDIFLYDPHLSIDADDDGIKALAEKVSAKGFVIGSVVAPVWQPTGGGPAMGSASDRQNFVGQVRKACHIAQTLRDLGVRPHGIVRIDSASGVADWAQNPEASQKLIAQTFAEACDVAEAHGERLAAEGEICWGGMHSWKKMIDLLEQVNRPATLGFQADMAHTLLYILGYNAPEDALLPPDGDWSDPARLDEALRTLTASLRPWTIDFHVAQNDGTVKGSGTHDKTGHHCLPNDPNGKLNIPHHAGFWLRNEDGQPTKAFKHICWDGCMFPNAIMNEPGTWNDILSAMIAVRDAHGWTEPAAQPAPAPAEITSEPSAEQASAPAPVEPPQPTMAPLQAKVRPPKAAAKPAPKAVTKPAQKPAKTAAPKRAQSKAQPPKRVKTKVVSKSKSKPKPAKVKTKAKPAKTKMPPKSKAKTVRAKAKKKATAPAKSRKGAAAKRPKAKKTAARKRGR
jgi:sugar phosphate isomerase/epimerase